MLKAPEIPDPVAPTPTQAARAPTRAWTANPAATARRPTAISSGGAATARPVTTSPGTVLGR